MNSLPIPDERAVGRAADAVMRVLTTNLPHFGSHPRDRAMAVRVARVALRTVWFSGPSAQPPSSSGPRPERPAERRWCFHCGGERPATYDQIAMRCEACNFATVALKRPRQLLQ